MSNSEECVEYAFIKLTGKEIANAVAEHVETAEELATKFNKSYLPMRERIKDLQELLKEMDEHLNRAEELHKVLMGENK